MTKSSGVRSGGRDGGRGGGGQQAHRSSNQMTDGKNATIQERMAFINQ